MSAVLENEVKAPASDGATGASFPTVVRTRALRPAAAAALPMAVAAFVIANVVARRRALRRRTRPQVDWKFAFFSGNTLTFRPTRLARLGVGGPGRPHRTR